ncbi:MAG: 50S ribosomal protein L9 [Clostridiales Family XIII bacterium]|jgi:large subunit ribosomal protein L9|nr:50S ribosomal protein L9 [Clostridiales Family XIII bacterium]
MIVILKQDFKGLGKAGDMVKVSDGHARNMLIPRGIAAEATDGNIRNLEKQKKLNEEKYKKDLAEAKTLAERLGGLSVKIFTKSGENGRLFGSITSKDIADALAEQHGIRVDKRKIALEGPIKNTGTVSAEIKIFPEVAAALRVDVEAQA